MNRSNNYYDETIEKLADLIQSNKMEEAKTIIDEELSMPYIPKDFETKLQAFAKQVHVALKDNQVPSSSIDLSKIESYLFSSDPDQQEYALALLEQANVRTYLPLIQKYLDLPDGSASIKTALLHILMEQQVSGEITIDKNGTSLSIDLSTLTPLSKTDALVKQVDVYIDALFATNAQLASMMKSMAWDLIVALYPIRLSNEADIDLLMHQLINVAHIHFDLDQDQLTRSYGQIKKMHKIH